MSGIRFLLVVGGFGRVHHVVIYVKWPCITKVGVILETINTKYLMFGSVQHPPHAWMISSCNVEILNRRFSIDLNYPMKSFFGGGCWLVVAEVAWFPKKDCWFCMSAITQVLGKKIKWGAIPSKNFFTSTFSLFLCEKSQIPLYELCTWPQTLRPLHSSSSD